MKKEEVKNKLGLTPSEEKKHNKTISFLREITDELENMLGDRKFTKQESIDVKNIFRWSISQRTIYHQEGDKKDE